MRSLIECLEENFSDLHVQLVKIAETFSEEDLFGPPNEADGARRTSAGEMVLRAAAAVEQVFGGITTRLWDDPFEWTLPEYLYDRQRILDYLSEVEQRRKEGFLFLKTDSDLEKMIPAPVEVVPIFSVLLTALTKAWYYLGKAHSLRQNR